MHSSEEQKLLGQDERGIAKLQTEPCKEKQGRPIHSWRTKTCHGIECTVATRAHMAGELSSSGDGVSIADKECRMGRKQVNSHNPGKLDPTA
jgi:hypothetical protein